MSPRKNITRLSPRQQETFRYLLLGEGEKRIAFLLGISANTVHAYVRTIYRRFDVHSRPELLLKILALPTMPIVSPARKHRTDVRLQSRHSADWQPWNNEVSC